MNAYLKSAGALALAMSLAGCMSTADPDWNIQGRVDGPMSPTFGFAVASMDNQIIDPAPAAGPPEVSAARAAAAVERYERGRVLVPQLGTSAFQGGGAGQGGGDSGAGGAGSSGLSGSKP